MSRKVINVVNLNGNANDFTITINLSEEEFDVLSDGGTTITNEEALIKIGVDFNTLNNLLLENLKTKFYLEVIAGSENKAYFHSPLGFSFIANQFINLTSLDVVDANSFYLSFSADNVQLSIQ